MTFNTRDLRRGHPGTRPAVTRHSEVEVILRRKLPRPRPSARVRAWTLNLRPDRGREANLIGLFTLQLAFIEVIRPLNETLSPSFTRLSLTRNVIASSS